MKKILKVIKLENLEIEGIVGKKATYEEISISEDGEKEICSINIACRCLFPEIHGAYNNNRQMTWKGDDEVNTIKVGDTYEGEIKEFTAFSIENRKIETVSCVIFSTEQITQEKELKHLSRQLAYNRMYPFDENGKLFYYSKTLIEFLRPKEEYHEDYQEGPEDYEEERLDLLTGGDINYDEFNGDWDDINTSRGLD